MKKDWKKISSVSNKLLRLLLITAKGEILEGLQKGFPGCFTNSESSQRLSMISVSQLAETIEHREDLIKVLKECGLPHQRFSFEGSCRGGHDTLPRQTGTYNTTRNGSGQYFIRSTVSVGCQVFYEDAPWMVVWNKFTPGNPAAFATHTFIIVPIEALY